MLRNPKVFKNILLLVQERFLWFFSFQDKIFLGYLEKFTRYVRLTLRIGVGASLFLHTITFPWFLNIFYERVRARPQSSCLDFLILYETHYPFHIFLFFFINRIFSIWSMLSREQNRTNKIHLFPLPPFLEDVMRDLHRMAFE